MKYSIVRTPRGTQTHAMRAELFVQVGDMLHSPIWRARCVLTDRDVMWGTVVMYRRRRDNLWYCNETFAPLAATIKTSSVILRMKR